MENRSHFVTVVRALQLPDWQNDHRWIVELIWTCERLHVVEKLLENNSWNWQGDNAVLVLSWTSSKIFFSSIIFIASRFDRSMSLPVSNSPVSFATTDTIDTFSISIDSAMEGSNFNSTANTSISNISLLSPLRKMDFALCKWTYDARQIFLLFLNLSIHSIHLLHQIIRKQNFFSFWIQLVDSFSHVIYTQICICISLKTKIFLCAKFFRFTPWAFSMNFVFSFFYTWNQN